MTQTADAQVAPVAGGRSISAVTGIAGPLPIVGSSGIEQPVQQYKAMVDVISDRITVANLFETLAHAAGGIVKVLPELACLPVLLDRDHQAVPLYYVLDVVDEVIDYDAIRREVPSLSLTQIAGAFSFLRALCQFNVNGVDLEEAEDQLYWDESQLFSTLQQAVADQVPIRVLASE